MDGLCLHSNVSAELEIVVMSYGHILLVVDVLNLPVEMNFLILLYIVLVI